MKTLSKFFGISLGLVLAGCGGSQAQPEHADGQNHHEHGGHGEHGKHAHPEMTGAVKAFHEILSPVYHMDKGAPRVEKTCGELGGFKDQAKAISGEAADDAAKKRAEALASSVDELDKVCAENGRPGVDASLEKVHEAFHVVMEAK